MEMTSGTRKWTAYGAISDPDSRPRPAGMGRLPLRESVAVAWLTGWKSALETEDLKVRAILNDGSNL